MLAGADVPPLLAQLRPDAVELHTHPGRGVAFAERVGQLRASGVQLQRLAVSAGLEGTAQSPAALVAELWQRFTLLRGAGFVDVAVHDAIVDEDVDVWSDNKAIDEGRREAIRAVYRSASPAFAALHGVRIEGGQIVDRMLFGLAVGTKPA